jgi:hypothetical protein
MPSGCRIALTALTIVLIAGCTPEALGLARAFKIEGDTSDATGFGQQRPPRRRSGHATPQLSEMRVAPACTVCGYPIVAGRNHDVPAPRAAKMFPSMTCKCGKPARVRCFNGLGSFWVECEDGHGVGRPA